MKLYRYMSVLEFIKMSTGKEIRPYIYEFENNRTTSEGLCFIGEETAFSDEDGNRYVYTPVQCYDFLDGIVNPEVLVEFESQNAENIHISSGVYANPMTDFFGDYISTTEYCMLSYQKDYLKPTRYAFFLDDYNRNKNEIKFIKYEAEKINITELLEHSNGLLKYSLLPSFPDGKAFWTEVEYAEPEVDQERTNEEWRKTRLIYGDLLTLQEECSIDMVLDTVELLPIAEDEVEKRPLVRFVLNGDCPSSWENLTHDFVKIIDKSSKDGTVYKNNVNEYRFKEFCNYVALCTAYPKLANYYKLYRFQESRLSFDDQFQLVMIRKDFNVEKITNEYHDMADNLFFHHSSLDKFLQAKLNERIRKNAISNYWFKKGNDSYSIMTDDGIDERIAEDQELYSEELERMTFIEDIGDNVTILHRGDLKVVLDNEPSLGKDLTLGEKYQKSVKREKAIEKLLEKALEIDENER